MPVTPALSVIIPTHNRPEALSRTLDSLAGQILPGYLNPGGFEVIVVDNGADNLYSSVNNIDPDDSSSYPFDLKILRHAEPSPTHARNLGAQNSQADVLVFLDDDICVASSGLAVLLTHCQQSKKTIFLGVLTLPIEILETSSFARAFDEPIPPADYEAHYTQCKTGLLAIRKEDFYSLGMFQDPTGGWPNWDDVDFGCRAQRQGHRFWICVDAVGVHWDYAARSLDQAAKRLERAGVSAVRLFQVYPELQVELPMFRDMLPFDRDQDDLRLRLRKFTRRIASHRLILWALEQIVQTLESFHVSAAQLRRWYTWVVGGHIFRGVQKGIRTYGSLPECPSASQPAT